MGLFSKKKVDNVIPCKSFMGVEFGSDRKLVREKFGNKYTEFKKSQFSENTTDDYGDFHIYYDAANTMEAVEVFGKLELIVRGKRVYPGTIKNAVKVFSDLAFDEGGYIAKDNSVGITPKTDNEDVIEAILFGVEGYYC